MEVFESMLNRRNISGSIKSAYNDSLENIEIHDDIWIKNNIFNMLDTAKINIYRSGTAKEDDYYNFDLIIRISNLGSGCSREYDGEITVFIRDLQLLNTRYKIFHDRTVFFN